MIIKMLVDFLVVFACFTVLASSASVVKEKTTNNGQFSGLYVRHRATNNLKLDDKAETKQVGILKSSCFMID